MRGFQPGKARAVPQNYADGGVVSTIKGMLGFGGGKKKPEPLPADLNKMPPPAAGQAASQPEPPKKAISEYSGMSALERRMKAAGLADGGLVRGPGTGISDDIEDDVEEGTFIMPADSTEAIGPEVMDQAGKAVPVRLSNGETKLPPEALQAIGAEVMEAIKEVTHTPAAKQSRGDDERMSFADGGVVRPEDRPRTIADLARSPGYGSGAGGPVNMPARPQVQPQVQQRPVSAPAPQPQASQPVPGVQRQGGSYTATTIADRARSPAFGMGATAPEGMTLTRPTVAQPAPTAPASTPTIASQVQRSGNSFSAAPAAPKQVGPAYPSHPDMPTSSPDGVSKAFGAIGDGIGWLAKTAVSAPGYGFSRDSKPADVGAGGGRGVVNPSNVDPSTPRPASTVQAQPQAAPDAPNPNTPPKTGDTAQTGAREVAPGIYRQGNSYGDSPEAAATGARPSQGPSARNNSIAEALATRSTGQQGQPADVMGIYARASEALKGVAESQRALDQYGPGSGSQGGGIYIKHSGNDWETEKNLKNLRTSASSITARADGRGRPSVEQQAYLKALDADFAARNGNNPATIEAMRQQGDTQRTGMRESGENARSGRRDGLAAELGRGQLDLQRNAQGFTTRQLERQEKLSADYDAAKTPEERATIAQKIRDLSGKNSQDGRYQLVRGEQVYDDKAQALRNTGERLYDTQLGKFVGGDKSAQAQPPKNHIDALKADPKLAAQFDEQYGPGASKQYIGG